jgi:glycosyltransferase involved in cell wall biosynthesis
LALKLARKFKIPWIADFRDGWMNNDFLRPTGKLNRLIQSAQERTTVRNANKVICISERILSHLNAGNSKKSVLVYNGFDLEDFDFRATGDDKFSLLHMGAITEWADPSVLFDSINYALKKEPELEKFLKIKIVGSVMIDSFYKRINDNDLYKYIKILGYKSHKDAVTELVNSNILLFAITIYNTPGLITGKIFEYLASGNPVLAHAREGEARQILSNYCQKVFFHDPEKADEAGDFIIDQFYNWKQNKGLEGESDREMIDIEKLKIFSREHQAEQIANILDSLSARKAKQ